LLDSLGRTKAGSELIYRCAKQHSEPGGVPAAVAVTVDAMGVATVGAPSQPVQRKRPAHYLWTALIARIYEVLPLLCPVCAGQRARGFCCPADVAMPSFV
jgi:hypothetical protein